MPHKVLSAIDNARDAGGEPEQGQIKLNAVITRSGNADQLLGLAGLARESSLEFRLIEFMDARNRNFWSHESILTTNEMVKMIDQS